MNIQPIDLPSLLRAVLWPFLIIRYTWLESASANAYASLGDLQFDPATGALSDLQITQMMQNFLAAIRAYPVPAMPIPLDPVISTPAPAIPVPLAPFVDTQDWVVLNDQVSEHAKWVDGARIERLLGSDLSRSKVLLPPDKLINDLTRVVLGQQGRFVSGRGDGSLLPRIG